MNCVCGLDHSKPLPDKFDYPPISKALLGNGDSVPYYIESSCHVCNAGAKGNEELVHHEDCKFIQIEEDDAA
jgi:hypothetical protein